MANQLKNPLLQIENLKVDFHTEEGMVKALDNISFTIEEGNIHGLIGETGCGKSVTSLTILGLLDKNAIIRDGNIFYKGEDILHLSDNEKRKRIRGNEISMIFQDPGSSLNPVYTSGNQVKESVNLYQTKDKKLAKKRVIEELNQVKLPDPWDIYNKFPHELSGGMKQRIMIAMMLACNSSLVLADEPTTALDVSIQAQFLKVLQELRKEVGISMLYVTHDMAVVSEICDVVTVMYAGQIVETAPLRNIFENPLHPYTIGLINSVPGVKQDVENFSTIEGTVPRLINPPSGCRFHPRCSKSVDICSEKKPPLKTIRGSHQVACHLVGGQNGSNN